MKEDKVWRVNISASYLILIEFKLFLSFGYFIYDFVEHYHAYRTFKKIFLSFLFCDSYYDELNVYNNPGIQQCSKSCQNKVSVSISIRSHTLTSRDLKNIRERSQCISVYCLCALMEMTRLIWVLVLDTGLCFMLCGLRHALF